MNRISIAPPVALRMVGTYLRTKLAEQIRSTFFIVAYLLVFQVLIFRAPLVNAGLLALGLGFVILGLTLFLEGIFLGLMPLGERIGLTLPVRGGLAAVLAFSLVLGVGATLAEPAISALRTAGSAITPWDSPLLFALLERYSLELSLVIGAGVGLAVALGMLRFYFFLSLKPFVVILMPLVLVLSWFAARQPGGDQIVGLAWDSGAVTTGVVTVPLILALGMGVSRFRGSGQGSAGGFGVVMLASALPVLAVLIFGLALSPGMPAPSTEEDFIQGVLDGRVRLISSDRLPELLENRGTPQGRHYYALALESSQTQTQTQNSPGESSQYADRPAAIPKSAESRGAVLGLLGTELRGAARAILPLAGVLSLLLFLVLRERTRYLDEVALGIVLSFLGLVLVTSGILLGLSPLGDEIGRRLPEQLDPAPAVQRTLRNFDETSVVRGYTPQGEPQQLVIIHGAGGTEVYPYREENHNRSLGLYELIVPAQIPLGLPPAVWGLGVVLVFAFGLGYGSTLAEPALAAMGKTVETMTVGTLRAKAIIAVVSLGVGFGLVLGVLRIVYAIPLLNLLLPGYGLALILTLFSEDDFVGIAWDAGGVTTGPVTVPLVLSLGLGIGTALGVSDGFGILALASLCPVITVLLYGILARIRRRAILAETEEVPHA